MRFHCYWRGSYDQVKFSQHGTMRAVRTALENRKGTLLDLSPMALDDALVEPVIPGRSLWVTARAFYQLADEERRDARRKRKQLAGCPLFELQGSLLPPAPPQATASDRFEAAVAGVLAADPADPNNALPRPFRRALAAGEFTGLADLLGRDEWELLGMRGIGPARVKALHKWVMRHTGRTGCVLGLPGVRRRLRPRRTLGPTAQLVEELPAAARRLHVWRLDLDVSVKRTLMRHNVRKVESLLARRDGQMLGWRNFSPGALASLQAALRALRKIASSKNIRNGADVEDKLVGGRPFFDHVNSVLDCVSARTARILRMRLLARPGRERTQREIGAAIGVSGSRVGGIEREALHKVDPDQALVRCIDARLRAISSRLRASPTLAQVEERDDWFSGVARQPTQFRNLLSGLGSQHIVCSDVVDSRST